MPTNRYTEVADVLRDEIVSGSYPPGTTLPTLVALRSRFDASNSTIREAIKVLVNEGLVYTAGRQGTIVREHRMLDHNSTRALRSSRPKSGQDVFVETVQAAGREARKTFEMKIAACADDVADRLGVPRGTLTVIRSLMQYVDGEPWSQEVSWYPRDLAEEVGLDVPSDIPQGTMRALREAGHREISWRDEIIARSPMPDEAQRLQIAPGVALMIHTRTAASAERVTRVTRAYRPGDRNRIIHDIGESDGIDVIVSTLASTAEGVKKEPQ